MHNNIAPRLRIVLVNGQVHRNIVRPTAIVDCSDSYMPDFAGEMCQRRGEVSRKRAYSALSRRVRAYNSDIISHNKTNPKIKAQNAKLRKALPQGGNSAILIFEF
jgi:hypothetical protein